MSKTAPTYKNHRFPIDIVARAIWLYFRFNVSLREVEEMMLERGVAVSSDPIANLFHFPRNTLSSADHRDLRATAMQI